MHALPLSLYLISRLKLWSKLQLRRQIYTPPISPLPLYVLCWLYLFPPAISYLRKESKTEGSASNYSCFSLGGVRDWTQIRRQQKRMGLLKYYIPSTLPAVLLISKLTVAKIFLLALPHNPPSREYDKKDYVKRKGGSLYCCVG